MKKFQRGTGTIDEDINTTIQGIKRRMVTNHAGQGVEPFTKIRLASVQVKAIILV